MKRLLIIIFSCFILFGCDNNSLFYLDDEAYDNNEFFEVNSDEFKKLEQEKKNFAIFVYAPGCTSCAAFKEVLTTFMTENNMSFYIMPTPEMKKTSIHEYMTYAPSMIIFKDGKMVSWLDAESNKDKKYYETSNNLKEWLSKYILIKKTN